MRRRLWYCMDKLPIWSFADTTGSLVDGLGVRSPAGVAYRVTVIVDPDNTIQHIYGTNLNVGRNPKDTLRVLDALQTDELCPCNREVGGDTLKAAFRGLGSTSAYVLGDGLNGLQWLGVALNLGGVMMVSLRRA